MASVCAAIACSAWMQNMFYSSDWRRGFDLASIYSNPFCNYRNGASKVPQSSTVPKRPYGKGQASLGRLGGDRDKSTTRVPPCVPALPQRPKHQLELLKLKCHECRSIYPEALQQAATIGPGDTSFDTNGRQWPGYAISQEG